MNDIVHDNDKRVYPSRVYDKFDKLPTPSKSNRLRDRVDMQKVEISRLRSLLYGEGNIRKLYDKWMAEVNELEAKSSKAAAGFGKAELSQRARKLKLRADELGVAAGFEKKINNEKR